MATNTLLKQTLKDHWVHFVAIGGTGMGALAGLFKSMGAKVTGSDGPIYPPMSLFLEAQKIPLAQNYTPQNLEGATWGFSEKHPHLVIIGNAISKTNEEAQAVEGLAAENKLRRMSFPEAIGEFMIQDRQSFVVAGTHGKTTTTSLMAWACEVLGADPGFFIGGIPKNFECGSRMGTGVFVSEGDEYDTAYWDKGSKFLHYRPTWVLGTGIEFDHVDIYSSLDQIEASFLKLTEKTSEGWLLIDRVSAPKASSVEKIEHSLNKLNKKCFRYGEDPESAYALLGWERCALPWNERSFGLKFEVSLQGEKHSFVTPMIGHHNLLNALGVLGVLHASGSIKKIEDFQEVLKTFKGITRRQDILHESNDFVLVDDFAHHPTAIKETVAAIKERFPQYSLAAFFEPRSATSARNTLYADFVKSFVAADAVFIQEATKKNVPENERLKVHDLVKEVVERGHTEFATTKKTVEELVSEFLTWKNKKERVLALVMSNGSFSDLNKKLLQAVKK
ncbi:MAG: Mur ligase family protein [Bdellovibrionota bacterium]